MGNCDAEANVIGTRVCTFSRFSVRLSVTSWTVARQASPPMGFSRHEYWSLSGNPLQYSCLENSMEEKTDRLQTLGL